MSGLRELLTQLEAAEASGRVTVRGVRPAVVLLDGGRIYLAERSDQPNLLIAMASADLFTGEEWALALRLPTREKWRALVADDDERLADLASFARRYTVEVLTTLMTTDVGTPTFTERVAHPFGPLGTWTLHDLVGDVVPDEHRPAPPAEDPILEPDAYDRREFLEMLLEVSPLVRTQL